MPGYETLEVLHKVNESSGNLPVEVSIEKQCRIRDDESKTRPFIKMQLVIGKRTMFCDPKQAEDLARLINMVLPHAHAATSQLAAAAEAEKIAAQEAWEERVKKGSGNNRRGVRKTGATERKREKERKGERPPQDKRKADRSQNDRDLRDKMQGRKG